MKGFISFQGLAVLNTGVFFTALFLSFGLNRFLIPLAMRFKLLDYPIGRKMHSKPVPYLGGVGIFIAFWTVIGAGLFISDHFFKKPGVLLPFKDILEGTVYLKPQIFGIFLGSFVILLTGFFDDRYRWSPLKKFAGQIAATAVLLVMPLRINLVEYWGVWGYVITFLWVLLIINAFNFIDSLDGHCAGIALISSLVFFWIVQIIRQPLDGLLLIAFAGALTGFLRLNFKPAKIFLGDNGSLFIGYIMAAFTLLCQYHESKSSFATSFIPIFIFGVPIYDTLSVVVVRLARGIPPWQGDRNHFAHRLVKIGMSERVAVIFSYFIAFTIGHIAILTTQVNWFGVILIGMVFVSILGVVAFLEFYVTRGIHIERR